MRSLIYIYAMHLLFFFWPHSLDTFTQELNNPTETQNQRLPTMFVYSLQCLLQTAHMCLNTLTSPKLYLQIFAAINCLIRKFGNKTRYLTLPPCPHICNNHVQYTQTTLQSKACSYADTSGQAVSGKNWKYDNAFSTSFVGTNST